MPPPEAPPAGGTRFFSLFLFDLGLAAHVRLEDLGDLHAAVGLEVVLQQGDEHAGRRHAGVVEGVGKVNFAMT